MYGIESAAIRLPGGEVKYEAERPVRFRYEATLEARKACGLVTSTDRSLNPALVGVKWRASFFLFSHIVFLLHRVCAKFWILVCQRCANFTGLAPTSFGVNLLHPAIKLMWPSPQLASSGAVVPRPSSYFLQSIYSRLTTD